MGYNLPWHNMHVNTQYDTTRITYQEMTSGVGATISTSTSSCFIGGGGSSSSSNTGKNSGLSNKSSNDGNDDGDGLGTLVTQVAQAIM